MHDNVLWQIFIAGTILFCTLNYFLVVFAFRYKNREQQHLLDKQVLIFELEKKELKLSFKERELVLQEISTELHDNIGQIVQLVARNLHTVKQYATIPAQIYLIEDVSELTRRVISEIRHFSHSHSSDFIKSKGLYKMLEDDSDRINANNQVVCMIRSEGEHNCLSPEEQLLVYRIAQEAINNALQHAGAMLIEIRLIYRGDLFDMAITDDGIGFNVAYAIGNGTMGLNNMQQRALLLGGILEINSTPGNGCIISLKMGRVPIIRLPNQNSNRSYHYNR